MELLKTLVIKTPDIDSQKIQIRTIDAADLDILTVFFQSIPQGDLIHFDENVKDSGYARRYFTKYPNLEQYFIAALADDEVVGICSLIQEINTRSAHIGEIKLFVLPEFRNSGIGFTMMKELYFRAMNTGIEKLIGKLPGSSLPLFQDLLDKLGFEQEAVLKNHIKDLSGRKQDLVIVRCFIENLWELISDWQSPYGRAMEY